MKNILVLCTGNSCRSILGEALFNHLGEGRVRAFSAGSFPVGEVNANTLAVLTKHGLSTEDYSSKSWDEFSDQTIDIVITVCDTAAGETCPVWLNNAIRIHWGLPDPAQVTGTEDEIRKAFETTYAMLEKRIRKMLALPFEKMSDAELKEALQKIGEKE